MISVILSPRVWAFFGCQPSKSEEENKKPQEKSKKPEEFTEVHGKYKVSYRTPMSLVDKASGSLLIEGAGKKKETIQIGCFTKKGIIKASRWCQLIRSSGELEKGNLNQTMYIVKTGTDKKAEIVNSRQPKRDEAEKEGLFFNNKERNRIEAEAISEMQNIIGLFPKGSKTRETTEKMLEKFIQAAEGR